MRARRYFQLVERESSEVSLKWKVLHTVVFIAIAVNSAIASYAISNLLNAFSSRCVLYAKPVFLIDNIGYFNKTNSSETTTEATTETTTDITTIETMVDSTIEPLRVIRSTDEIEGDPSFDNETEIFFSNSKKNTNETSIDVKHLNTLKPIPDTKDCYLSNNTIVFKNDSMYGEVNVKMAKADPPYVVMCDFVSFLPLFSLVVASVFAAIIIVFGRGGRGYPSETIQQGWRYIYFILILSLLLFGLFLIATNLINSGTQRFCSHFSLFTGKNKCNKFINYFSLRTKLVHAEFYGDYLIAYYTYIINTCLWTAQLLLILWRIFSIADFKFYNILVKVKHTETDGNIPTDSQEEINEKEFQKVHQVLKSKEIGTKEDVSTPSDDDEEEQKEECDENTESTARV